MANVVTTYREFNFGVAALAVVMLCFGIAAANGFGRRTSNDSCFRAPNGCYCENISRPDPSAAAVLVPQARRAAIKQPLNTWSNVGFIIAGLGILWWIGWNRASVSQPALANRMTRTAFYPGMYGAMTMFMGPGSMFFHASLKHWGGWLDSVSMYLFMSYILTYNVTRFWNWPRWAWGLSYAGVNLPLAILAWIFHEQSTNFFALLGLFALCSQLMIAYTSRVGTDQSGHWWFFGGLVSFVTAFVIWRLAWTGGPLCVPRGFQGHLIWHLLCAFTVFSVYKYFRAESRVVAPLPGVLRVFIGIAVGGGLAGAAGYLAMTALGAADTTAVVVAIGSAVVGGTYAAIALGYNVYMFGVMSSIGLVLDVTWSILNTIAGLLVWIPAALISGGKFQTPDPSSRRSGSFVYDKNPRGGGYAATTIGTVIGGGWSSHEEIHVWQARIFGPMFMLAYILAFVLNVIFRLLTFRKSNLVKAAYERIPFEDWAYWAGSMTGAKIKWAAWIGGFFLCLLYVGLLLTIVLAAASGQTALLVAGIVCLALFSLIRALLPGH
jgi:hypothetical protein